MVGKQKKFIFRCLGGAVLSLGVLLSGCTAFQTAANLEAMRTLTLTPTQRVVEDPLPSATIEGQPSALDSNLPDLTQAVTAAPAQSTSEPGENAPTTAPSPQLEFDAAAWQSLPVIPDLSPHAQQVLLDGLARGNNPRAFSKIGDCESRTTWFLGDFDLGEAYYNLGPYSEALSPVLPYYSGSFNRLSQAANPGFTAASLFSPLWSDRKVCEKGETPLACEYRLQKPSAAFIMLGTNDATNPKTFEGHMRKVIEFSLEQGVLPILGTKADNVEGDHHINQTLARLAYEYDVPLWNYWLAVQELPDQGLQSDGAHLTFAAPFFDQPETLQNAWPVRNLNALQILKKIMSVYEKSSP